VVSAATGRPTLLHWLLAAPATAAELRDRQTAVTELATATSFREELAVLAQQGRDIAPQQFESLLVWAEATDDLLVARSRGVIWAARIIPLITLFMALLAFFRRVPWIAPGISILAGLLLLGRYRATLSAGL